MATAYDRMVRLRKYREDIDMAASGYLLDPRELMMGLYANGVVEQELKNLIKMQVDIAKRKDDRKWLCTVARESDVFVNEDFLEAIWVDNNIYLVRRVRKKAKRWTNSTRLTTDIRKSTDASLETVTENAAPGFSIERDPTSSVTASGTVREHSDQTARLTITVDNPQTESPVPSLQVTDLQVPS